MTIVAEADFVGSATEVAVTFASEGLGIVAGAVYSPEDVMVPHEPLTQPVPETFHVTAAFEVPVTLAVNCCCPLIAIVTSVGEIDTATAVADPMVTLALPIEPSVIDVALTVTLDGFGTVAGAV